MIANPMPCLLGKGIAAIMNAILKNEWLHKNYVGPDNHFNCLHRINYL
jgi:hypothetical protein